jgi:hypothetical protein
VVQQARSGAPALQCAPEDDASADPVVARVQRVAAEAGGSVFAKGSALVTEFSDIQAMSVEQQALVIAAVGRYFPEQVAQGFANWVSRGSQNAYLEQMEHSPAPEGNQLPGLLTSVFGEMVLRTSERGMAFVDGYVEGAELDSATNAKIIAKFAEGSLATGFLPGVFIAGAVHGAASEIGNLISSLVHLPEILSALDETVQRLLSDEGVQVAHDLGFMLGQEHAAELTGLLDMNVVQLVYWMGKQVGPIVAGIIIGLLTGCVVQLWRSWGTIREGIAALVDLSRLRLAQAAQGIRVLDAPPGGMVMIHREGPIEWWVPAETDDEMARSTDDLDEVTELMARGRKLDPSQVERRVTNELDLRQKQLERSDPGLAVPDRTAATRAAQALRGTAPDLVLDVVRQTNIITRAFADPEAFGAAMRKLQEQVAGLTEAEIATEAERLAKAGVVTPLQRETAAYAAAVRKLATEAKTGVVEIVPSAPGEVRLIRESGEVPVKAPGGILSHDDFMNNVVRTGDMILDYTFLNNPHSAITHAVQDLVADEALRTHGFKDGVAGYRKLLGELHDLGTSKGLGGGEDLIGPFSAGTAFWLSTFDASGGIAQPEFLGPIIRKALNMSSAKAL